MAKAGDFIKKFGFMKKERIKTNILPLDIILNNAFELGGCFALSSPPGGGKSTLVLQMCKFMCDAGRFIYYIDIEQGIKPEQITGAGLDKYLEPINGEDYPRFQGTNEIYSYNDCQNAIRDIIAMKKEGKCNFDMVITDSLSSLVSETVLEGSAEAATMAVDARPLSKVIKSIRGPLGVAGITLFNIVQAASNIGGGMYAAEWVAKVTKAIEHAVDALILLEHPQFNSYKILGKKKTPNGEEDIEIGYWGKIYTTKGRSGLNRIKLNIPMIAGKGCDNIMYLKRVLLETGVFVKGTKYYKYNDASGNEQKIEGEANFEKFVKENYQMLVKMMYDLGFFDLTNNTVVNYIAAVEPAEVGDGNVSEEELRNEQEGTVTLDNQQEPDEDEPQFV